MTTTRAPIAPERGSITLFLCGDVMTGRGIDQIMPAPVGPDLQESYVRDARWYVRFAEEKNGPIPRPVAPVYIWGEALTELERVAPQARIVNLETSITRSDAFWPDKGIHYRMAPENVGCLTAARIDVCALANNHVLDFGGGGLLETLTVLRAAGVKTAGAGGNPDEARAPATLELPGGRAVHVFSFATESSGVPAAWAAAADRPGVDLVEDLSEATAVAIGRRVLRVKRDGDLVVASLHWGSNWGYEVPPEQVRFAHRLVDAGVDLVHGHSSHHPRPLEVYEGRLILYGCGDLLTDYEGIRGYEAFRNDLGLMYFPTLAPEGTLAALRMIPMKIRRMRLQRASPVDAGWMRDTLEKASRRFRPEIDLDDDATTLVLRLR